jgi:hypothetical protein
MTRYSVRVAGVAAIFALCASSLVAVPAAAAPLLLTQPTAANPPAVTPDEATSDESSQDYDVEKHGSKVEVTNTEEAPASLEVSGSIIEIAQEVAGDPTVFLALDSGIAVPLDIELPSGVGTGSTFVGTLSLTDEVTDDLDVAVSETAPIESESALGEQLTDAAIETDTELPVEDGTFSAPLKTAALDGSVREINVAFVRPANSYSGATLLQSHFVDMVATAEDYWVRESQGEISGFEMPLATVPTIQSSYNCTSATAAVNMWIQAWSKYKQDYYATSAPLYSFVVVVPAGACQSRAGFIGLGNVIGAGFDITGQGQSSAGAPLQALSSTLIDARSTGAKSGGVLIHELGHNFGLGHSDWFACTSSSYIDYKYTSGKSCATFDYYDFYDPMGFEVDDPGVLSAPNKIKLGILTNDDPDGFVTVPSLAADTVSTTTTVTIKPISDDSGVRAIRVRDPILNTYYYVEYRSGTGADSGALYKTLGKLTLSSAADLWSHGTGVRVLKNYGGGGVGDDTLELSSIPSVDSLNSRALTMQALDGFTSYGGGIQVDVVSITPGVEAEIQITLRHKRAMAPKLSGPSLEGTQAVGSTLTLTNAKNWHKYNPSFSKKWLHGGVTMCSQPGYTYTIKPYEKALPITAQVTAKMSGTTTGVASPTVVVAETATTEAPNPTLSLSGSTQRYGASSGVTATVVLDGSLDGTITIIDCDTAVLENVAIDVSGTTTFALPTSVPAGTRTLRAVYVPADGSGHFGSISGSKTLKVYKGTVKPVIVPEAATGTRGVPFTIDVTIPDVNGVQQTGKVAYYINDTRVAVHTLVDGSTSFTHTMSKTGTKKLVVKYGGNSNLYYAYSLRTYITFS